MALLKMINEIHYWEKLMFETPHYVSEVYQKKEDLRILRENVMLVIRDYNRLVIVIGTRQIYELIYL
jgi:dynein heavy chain